MMVRLCMKNCSKMIGCENSLEMSQANAMRSLYKQTGFNVTEHSKQLSRDDCSFLKSFSRPKIKGSTEAQFTESTHFHSVNGAKVNGAR